MKIFKSKISIPLLLFVIGTITASSIVLIATEAWIGLFIMIPVAWIALYSFTSIRYIIQDNKLIITIGILYKKVIDISTIHRISKTNNPLSAPAASLDRLEVVYNNNQTVFLSPQQQDEFIKELQLLNYRIEASRGSKF